LATKNSSSERFKIMLISLLITTFKRDHLLKHTLPTIKKQKLKHDLEVIVINDGTHDQTEQIAKEYGCKYIFTGHRNLDGEKWRVPGFAFNIGFKRSSGDIIILSCAEIYHIGNVLNKLIDPVLDDKLALGIPQGKDDNKLFLNALESSGNNLIEIYNKLGNLNVKLPFLFSMHRSHYEKIRGYDEDFIGMAFDDRDFVDRLLDLNCHYVQTDAQCVHLYHSRSSRPGRTRPLHEHNRQLYLSRKGIIVRNKGKEWGVLNEK